MSRLIVAVVTMGNIGANVFTLISRPVVRDIYSHVACTADAAIIVGNGVMYVQMSK